MCESNPGDWRKKKEEKTETTFRDSVVARARVLVICETTVFLRVFVRFDVTCR